MDKAIKSTLVFKTIKTKTAATVISIAAAVALPQLFHLLGMVSNMGTSLGETFLPMHIAIFMVGLLAGPVAGIISGALAPLASFLLTSMPSSAMLPFMIIELAMYGLISGLLAEKKLPTGVKLLAAQFGGRAVRAAAILFGYYLLQTKIAPSVILTSIYAGLPGLILQWVIIPLVIYWINSKACNE